MSSPNEVHFPAGASAGALNLRGQEVQAAGTEILESYHPEAPILRVAGKDEVIAIQGVVLVVRNTEDRTQSAFAHINGMDHPEHPVAGFWIDPEVHVAIPGPDASPEQFVA